MYPEVKLQSGYTYQNRLVNGRLASITFYLIPFILLLTSVRIGLSEEMKSLPSMTSVETGIAVSDAVKLDLGQVTHATLRYQRVIHFMNWSIQLSGGTIQEYTFSERVEHEELRLRMLSGLSVHLSQAILNLSGGVSGTYIYEQRTRHQSGRIGMTDLELRSDAQTISPGLIVEAGILLPIVRQIGVSLRGITRYAVIDPLVRSRWGKELAVGISWTF